MERQSNPILERLGKLLAFVRLNTRNWANGSSEGAHGESSDHPYRPSPTTHSPLTSSPLIPTFLMVLVVLTLLSSAPVQQWLVAGGQLPSISELPARIWNWHMHSNAPSVNENVSVWAKKQFGFYYCQGGVLFGREPGELMAQGEALLSGYRPAGGQYCGSDRANEAAFNSPSARLHRFIASVENLPTPGLLSLQIWKKKSPPPKGSVNVWAKKQVGFYYCRGDVLFGRKPGKLITQREALMSGYQPAARQYCSDNKPVETSASSLFLAAPSGNK